MLEICNTRHLNCITYLAWTPGVVCRQTAERAPKQAHLLGNYAADEGSHGGEVPRGGVRERPDDLLIDLRLLGGRLVQALAERQQLVRVRLAVRRRQPPVRLLHLGFHKGFRF